MQDVHYEVFTRGNKCHPNLKTMRWISGSTKKRWPLATAKPRVGETQETGDGFLKRLKCYQAHTNHDRPRLLFKN